MGPEGAVNILYRRELDVGRRPRRRCRAEKVAEFREKFANPFVAASRGFVDEVIQPRHTRAKLIDCPGAPVHQARSEPAEEAREHSALAGSMGPWVHGFLRIQPSGGA